MPQKKQQKTPNIPVVETDNLYSNFFFVSGCSFFQGCDDYAYSQIISQSVCFVLPLFFFWVSSPFSGFLFASQNDKKSKAWHS